MSWRTRPTGPALAWTALLALVWTPLLPATGANGSPAERQADDPRVLVMPFERDGVDARTFWLGEAVALLLSDRLVGAGTTSFTRDDRLYALDYFNILPTVSISRAMTVKIATAIGATDVIVGEVAAQGDLLGLRARRLDLASGRYVAQASAKSALDDLNRAIGELAISLGFTAGGAASSGLSRLPLDAFESFVKGLLTQNPSRQVGLLEAAVAAAPEAGETRLALWRAHTNRANYDEALKGVQDVPRSAPSYRVTQFSAGLSLVALKRLDEAFATFKTLADEVPTAPLFNNLGVVQLRRGATPTDGRAVYYFNRAAELERDDPDYCFNLGYSYWLDRDMSAAIYWLREAVRRDASDGDAHLVLAAVLQATGAAAEAQRERDLAKLLSSRVDESELRVATVPRGLERLSNDLEVPRVRTLHVALGETVGREQLELAGFHVDRGRRLFEQGQDALALTELRKAVYLSPYVAAPHVLIGRIHQRFGQARQAIDAFRVALWCEETAETRLTLAKALVDARQTAEARVELQRVLQIDPGSSEAKRLLEELAKSPPKH